MCVFVFKVYLSVYYVVSRTLRCAVGQALECEAGVWARRVCMYEAAVYALYTCIRLRHDSVPFALMYLP